MSSVDKIIIVGFSGFGKEVFFLAKRLGIEVHGFLDDSPNVQGDKFAGKAVLGRISDWKKYSDCKFVIAIGNPAVREKIYNEMLEIGVPRFATLVDPAAIVLPEMVEIGEGSIICAGTVCTVNISIGKQVIINLNCTIGHDSKVGDFATIAPMVAVSGNVDVGRSVEIGTSASIRQGLSIGSGAMLGMGSVLTKNMPEKVVFFGSPAKCIRNI
jgi:sugar O-acyltransferase (sialic acid O-acetyltransferase NeuD family)